ncbi:MAG: class I SAM-dependent methyltransferase [Saprospiraceae bacterium]
MLERRYNEAYKDSENLIGSEFDAVAGEYDATFSRTAVGMLLRQRVWALLSDGVTQSHPVTSVLELNCGTGEDAIWLVNQGFQVLATDASPKMVAIAKAKIERAGLTEKASFRVCSFAEIEQLPERDFDLIFSNFGGLNCVSPEELGRLGAVFAQKLKPGGIFIAVVMSRFCWWEILYFLLKLKPREAFRRFSKKPVEARLDTQTTISTWYYSPAEFQKHLQFNEMRSIVQPIGFWLPPSYLNPFFDKRPSLLCFLNFLEMRFAPSWLAFAADHYWVSMESPRDARP